MEVAEPLRGITRVTEEDVARYREEGYLAIEEFFATDEVALLQATVDEFVERSRSVTESDDVFDLESSHTPQNPKLRRLKKPHLRHPVFAATAKSEKLLDLVAALVGSSVRFRGGKLNVKPPLDGSPVEWHQDWAFHPHTNDDMLVVGIGINDQTQENGCLMVVPGSHKGPVLDHHQDGVFIGAVDPNGFAERAVCLTVQSGGITAHHARTLHASAPNFSNEPRLLLLFDYAAGDAWPLFHADWDTLNAEMVRGELAVTPRMEDVPVRLPFPRDLSAKGSIVEVQKLIRKSGFASSEVK